MEKQRGRKWIGPAENPSCKCQQEKQDPGFFPDLLGIDSVILQVPRAFVNMVNALEIIKLREIYLDTRVSCPRLILRSGRNFSSCF
jgi:hypothetical protein